MLARSEEGYEPPPRGFLPRVADFGTTLALTSPFRVLALNLKNGCEPGTCSKELTEKERITCAATEPKWWTRIMQGLLSLQERRLKREALPVSCFPKPFNNVGILPCWPMWKRMKRFHIGNALFARIRAVSLHTVVHLTTLKTRENVLLFPPQE